MKLIRQIAINDASLVSSSIAENDYAEWSAATVYTSGSRTIKGHRIFESVQAGNIGHDPGLGDVAWWVDTGPTNLWAMFDSIVGTASSAENSLSVTLAAGRIDALALLQIDASTVTVDMRRGADQVYFRSVSMLDESAVIDWFSYFYEPSRTKDFLVLTDLPVIGEASLTITLAKPSGTVSVGVCLVGLQSDLGRALSSPTLGINDYSRKEVDTFGNVTLVKRSFAKKMGIKLVLKNSEVDRVHAVLSAVRATPAIWFGSDTYSSMLVYGFYRDFEIDISYAYESYCTLNIEGMI